MKIILAIIGIIILIQIGIFGFLYFTSDEVNCNFIFCEFTKIKENSINQTCYQNGELIDCGRIINFEDVFPELFEKQELKPLS